MPDVAARERGGVLTKLEDCVIGTERGLIRVGARGPQGGAGSRDYPVDGENVALTALPCIAFGGRRAPPSHSQRYYHSSSSRDSNDS